MASEMQIFHAYPLACLPPSISAGLSACLAPCLSLLINNDPSKCTKLNALSMFDSIYRIVRIRNVCMSLHGNLAHKWKRNCICAIINDSLLIFINIYAMMFCIYTHTHTQLTAYWFHVAFSVNSFSISCYLLCFADTNARIHWMHNLIKIRFHISI